MSKTALLFVLCLLSALLAGCGGSGGPGTPSLLPSLPNSILSGQAQVNIIWPAAQAAASQSLTPHLIPTASNSIRIAIVDPLNPLGPINQQVLARPTASPTSASLPVRALTVNVTAYANTTGTGVVLAAASGTLAVAGPADTAVQWSVVGSATSGSIAPDGTYTVPATAGAYTVTGISHFDPKRQISAAITVQSGNGTVTVQ